MNWGALIDSLTDGRRVVSLATATTGLSPEDGDQLIAVCIDETLLLRKVDNDLLLKSQEYHKITPQMVNEHGVDDDVFREQLNAALDNTIAMTYNVDFQQKFLEPWKWDVALAQLPSVYRGAATRMAIDDGGDLMDYFSRAAGLIGGKVGFKRLVDSLGIYADDAVSLPVEQASSQLWQLYNRLRALPVTIQARIV